MYVVQISRCSAHRTNGGNLDSSPRWIVWMARARHFFLHANIDIWAATWENQQNECAPSGDSDQPGHPPSLIRVFAVHMKKAWVLSYPLSAQRRLWSVWADAQADLSLCWAHTHFVGFVMSWLIFIPNDGYFVVISTSFRLETVIIILSTTKSWGCLFAHLYSIHMRNRSGFWRFLQDSETVITVTHFLRLWQLLLNKNHVD